jgi:nucleoside-diphosphate-sugar epimerase
MRIAVTGGTGFVGSALVDRAIAEGHEIVALTRRPQDERKGVTWVSGDLEDGHALRTLVSDADTVIHVAGVVKANKPAEFERGNATGTLNLIDAAREPELSTYCASKAQAEKLVKASSLDWTIVRPAVVYGPRDSEMLDLFRTAKWWFVPVPGDGRTSVIHVDDLVGLLLALLPSGENSTSTVFEPDDGATNGWSHYDLARAIGWAMGRRRLKVIGVSRRVMEWAARLDRLLRGSKAKLTLDRAAYFSHPDWVVSGAAMPPAELWKSRVETREGLKATAEWYRAEGWL